MSNQELKIFSRKITFTLAAQNFQVFQMKKKSRMLLNLGGASSKEKCSTGNKQEFHITFYLLGFEFLNVSNLVTTRKI